MFNFEPQQLLVELLVELPNACNNSRHGIICKKKKNIENFG